MSVTQTAASDVVSRENSDTAAASPPGYLQGMPTYLILGSFVVLTLPLCVLALCNESLFVERHRWLLFGYMWLLGSTHFVITLTVYLQSANLRHFNSTWKNRVMYFAVPVLLLVGFDLYLYFDVPLTFPVVGMAIFAIIRWLDFNHFSKQSFGVLQMFQARGRKAFPSWLRKIQNYFFQALTVLLLITFLAGGRFAPHQWSPVVRCAALGILGFVVSAFVMVVIGYYRAWLTCEDRRVLYAPALYLLMQAIAGGLAVYSTALYIFCLAVHYVEYHVLMYPRCFRSQLDDSSLTDRIFRMIRSRRSYFYGLVLLAAALYAGRSWHHMGGLIADAESTGVSPLFILVALFDGLFVLHYFLEMLIWKFSTPYYRQNLGPLYFT